MDWTPVLTGLTGLGGVALGGYLTARDQREERRQQFIRDQLDRLYSPLLARREQSRAAWELQGKLSADARKAWQELVRGRRQGEGVDKKESEPYERLIEYNNQQYREQLATIYKGMVEVFAGNLWLAEQSMRAHFRTLVELVDIWTRIQEQSVPFGVALELDERGDTSEARLLPFYKELETQVEQLREELKKGRGQWWSRLFCWRGREGTR